MKRTLGGVLVPLVLGAGCLSLAVATPTWRDALAQAGSYRKEAVIFDCWTVGNKAPQVSVVVSGHSSGAPKIAHKSNCAQAISDLFADGYELEDISVLDHPKNVERSRSRFLFLK